MSTGNRVKPGRLEKAHSLSRGWDDFMRGELADAERAQTYLEVAIDEFRESGDGDDFLEALRYLAKANGGIAEVARKTGFNRESLYRMLSNRGNPEFRSLDALLHALGFRLAVAAENKH